MVISFLLESIIKITVPAIQPLGTDKNLYIENQYNESHSLRPLSQGLSNNALITVDQYGFRQTSIKVDTGNISYLLIGDSVTLGIGVHADSTFAGIIQSNHKEINILNPSMIGYNIDDYLNLIDYYTEKKQVEHFKIERIVLCWCINDIYNNSDMIKMPGGKIRFLFNDLLSIIRSKSRLYLLTKKLLYDRPKSYYQYDSKLYADRLKLDSVINKIIIINNRCRANSIRFETLLLPYEYQLRGENHDQLFPQSLMENRLRLNGIQCINPIKWILRQNIQSKKLFLFGDGIHLSNYGHRIIANYFLMNR